jgi:hypothetical protein
MNIGRDAGIWNPGEVLPDQLYLSVQEASMKTYDPMISASSRLSNAPGRAWASRQEATQSIKQYVQAQGYRTLIEKENKGGSAVTFRCYTALKEASDCPMFIKLRKSKKYGNWYVAGKICLQHTCDPKRISEGRKLGCVVQ